jgi:catechol 2,3-dioxygenase-like lactoylglutathione lyase family enzyme
MPGFRVDLLQVKGSLPHRQVADHMLEQSWGHIVFGVADVDKTYAILKSRGVVLPEAPATNEKLHIRTAHFPDSEGNWLEIYEDLPAK